VTRPTGSTRSSAAGSWIGDVLEAQVYDLDTGFAITSATVTVPTTGGPTTADSSAFNIRAR
jgi:hypothetical protein